MYKVRVSQHPLLGDRKKRAGIKKGADPRTHDELGILPMMEPVETRKVFSSKESAKVVYDRIRLKYPRTYISIIEDARGWVLELCDSYVPVIDKPIEGVAMRIPIYPYGKVTPVFHEGYLRYYLVESIAE